MTTTAAATISPFPDNPKARRPRIALVGCGRVGNIHRERLAALPADIVAVCDPDSDALARMAVRLPHRPRLFRSEQDLLAAQAADAVILCTPHARHAVQVRAALEAGVHVLCEKPFVSGADEARRLVTLARERERALFVSLARRGRGHARFLLAAASRIAPLQQIVMSRAQPWLARHERTWRVRPGEGGGFLTDAGASLLDLLLSLAAGTGASLVPTRVDARLTRSRGSVDVRASLGLSFSPGPHADVTLIGDATEAVEVIQLFGENGTAGWLLREGAPPLLYLRPQGGPAEEADSARFRGPLPDDAFVTALATPGRTFGQDHAPDLFDAAFVVPLVALLERIHAEAGLS
jgi:predicted dehydrogenase